MKYSIILFLLFPISCGRSLDQVENRYVLFVEHEAQHDEESFMSEWLLSLYLYLGGANWIER